MRVLKVGAGIILKNWEQKHGGNPSQDSRPGELGGFVDFHILPDRFAGGGLVGEDAALAAGDQGLIPVLSLVACRCKDVI
jgi:hypothetical protein